MRIGVFVGSFNPPHNGHYNVAKYLIDEDIVDKVLLLPTPNYWDKNNLVNVEDRVNMLKFYEDKNIIVDSTHNQFPYTYQVLRSLKKDYSNDQLYLVIGSDQLEKFHLWKNIDEILKNKVIVLRRGNEDIYKYIEQLGKDNFIVIDDFPFIDISSTTIRNNLDNKYIDKRVLDYIKKHNLYS